MHIPSNKLYHVSILSFPTALFPVGFSTLKGKSGDTPMRIKLRMKEQKNGQRSVVAGVGLSWVGALVAARRAVCSAHPAWA